MTVVKHEDRNRIMWQRNTWKLMMF